MSLLRSSHFQPTCLFQKYAASQRLKKSTPWFKIESNIYGAPKECNKYSSTYSEEEMKGLINDIRNKNDFEWEVGRIRSGPGYILYLLGVEKK